MSDAETVKAALGKLGLVPDWRVTELGVEAFAAFARLEHQAEPKPAIEALEAIVKASDAWVKQGGDYAVAFGWFGDIARIGLQQQRAVNGPDTMRGDAHAAAMTEASGRDV